MPQPTSSFLILATTTALLLVLVVAFLSPPGMHTFRLSSSSAIKAPRAWQRPGQRGSGGALLTRRSSSGGTAAAGSAEAAGARVGAVPPKAASKEALAAFDRVFRPDGSGDRRPVVLFDGVCAFCNRGVDTILCLDVNRKLRFAPLQSTLGRQLMEACGRDPDDLSSMVVVEGDRRLALKSDAAIRIAEVAAPHPALGAAFEKAARLLLPQGLRDGAYDTIAENRYSILGKRDECRLPDPGDDRFLA